MFCEHHLFSTKSLSLNLCLLALTTAVFHSSAGAQNIQRIEELSITATRQDRTIQNIAGTISLITQENIEKEMVDDLDDLARFQPGVCSRIPESQSFQEVLDRAAR